MEEKIWFILLQGKQKGPYSLSQLKKNKKITLETFVWREGWEKWIPIKNVPELKKALFKGKQKISPKIGIEEEKVAKPGEEALALEWRGKNPLSLFLILILAALLFLYLFLMWRKF